MSNEAALIILDYGQQTATPTARAAELKEAALAQSGLIGRVASAEDNARSVDARQGLKTYLDMVEAARNAANEVPLAVNKAINAKAKEMANEAQAEYERLGKLEAGYAVILAAQQRSAEALHNAELTEIERRREELLAIAETHKEREKIIERANQEAQLLSPPKLQVKAYGQSIRDEWEIESIDDLVLMNFVLLNNRRDLFRAVQWDKIAIKAALKAGQKLPGVTAHLETKSRVRTSKGLELEVAR